MFISDSIQYNQDIKLGRHYIANKAISRGTKIFEENCLFASSVDFSAPDGDFFSMIGLVKKIVSELYTTFGLSTLLKLSKSHDNSRTAKLGRSCRRDDNLRDVFKLGGRYTEPCNIQPSDYASTSSQLKPVYHAILGIVMVNCFYSNNNDILYLHASLFSHDCESNCFWYIDAENRMTIYANRNIEPNEVVSIAYTETIERFKKCKYACTIHNKVGDVSTFIVERMRLRKDCHE